MKLCHLNITLRTELLFWKCFSKSLRSVLGFNKLTPLESSQFILDQYYGKNRLFTKSVDEMKIILNMKRERCTQTVGKTNSTTKTSNTSVPKNGLKVSNLTVLLHRLTKEEIAQICQKIKKSKQKRK